MVKYLDYSGLSYFWGKLKAYFVAKEAGKGLSTNDFTDAYKSAIDNLATTYKALQEAVADPTAAQGESAVEFISGITQNAQGVISPTKKAIRAASTTQSGVVQLSSALDSESETQAATAKAAKDLKDAIDAVSETAGDAIPASQKGAANGVAPLDGNGLIDSQYLPSYVDDVIEVYPVTGATALSAGWFSATKGGTALTPETGKIYVLMEDITHTSGSETIVDYSANTQFRWAANTVTPESSTYVQMLDGGVSSITNGEIDTIMAN